MYASRKAARETREGALAAAEKLEELLRSYRARSVAPARRASSRRSVPSRPDTLMRVAASAAGVGRAANAEQLARRLQAAARRDQWQLALSLFALFGEASPDPSPALSSLATAGARYERLCREWPGSPPWDRALASLPPHLEVGLREYPRRLVFGVQVKRAEDLAAIARVIDEDAVAPIARAVLTAMGSEAHCEHCRKTVLAVHVLRARGIDEVHGLACPECASVFRSYRSFGGPEGLEALAPYAVSLGLVVEQPVTIGSSTVVLGLLPKETKRLGAKHVVERLSTLLLDDVSTDLRSYVRLTANGKKLPAGAAIRPATRLRVALEEAAPMSIKELERELTSRAQSRFRAPKGRGVGRRRS